MATTKIFPIHADVEGTLAYIANPEKTDNGRLVYAFSCSEKPSRAARDFAEIRSRRSTVLAQHFIFSFKPGEITPERELEVGKEICSESSDAHYKSAIQVWNRCIVDHSDLVVCCIQHKSGGAYKTVQYAKKQGKQVRNRADSQL